MIQGISVPHSSSSTRKMRCLAIVVASRPCTIKIQYEPQYEGAAVAGMRPTQLPTSATSLGARAIALRHSALLMYPQCRVLHQVPGIVYTSNVCVSVDSRNEQPQNISRSIWGCKYYFNTNVAFTANTTLLSPKNLRHPLDMYAWRWDYQTQEAYLHTAGGV